MSPLILKQPNGPFPRLGFGFTDRRTGREFNGMDATLDMQVMRVIEHRQRNPKLYLPTESQHFDRVSVQQEILQQLQSRQPELFVGYVDPNVPVKGILVQPPPTIAIAPKACLCGNAEAQVTYCATCAGKKIISYTCTKCGASRSP